ncbi:Bromodomain-containing protein [Patellaria atrata CBS 101060]|uniref:Bromodomain-containing protein n=1 Tax=Patellaria atrata CBS 101060 TaxID=1346257 RepID=A0A9P4VPJ1_9PEZI|nr:Bromodomain-containing protein [Patellaria atrata CBS 101060]
MTERDNKRKAAVAASPEGVDGRASKRQKLPNGEHVPTLSHDDTIAVGQRFIDTLKAARDKTGRPIATSFLTLPDENQFPGYYEQVQLPIAFDTIEEKLRQKEYTNLSQVEGDVKRMVQNAKQFNDRKSAIYDDAERVRKAAFNFMVKHNPSYKDPNYAPAPTPIPGQDANGTPRGGARNRDTRAVATSTPKVVTPKTPVPKIAAAKVTPVPKPVPKSAPPAVVSALAARTTSAVDSETNFEGKSFQEAQEMILDRIISYQEEESELQIFTPFVNLPPRSLTDYYALIKNPVSLRGVQKRIRGQHGRSAPSGITDFKSWNALEEEMSVIWRNARAYNEDGSDIYILAGELETFFKDLLVKAKASVEEPPQPKIKLNLGPKQPSLKLRFSTGRGSPSSTENPNTPVARSSATPGVIVDNDALERQQQHVLAGMNGQQQTANAAAKPLAPRNPFSRAGSSGTPVPPGRASAQPLVEQLRAASAGSPGLMTNGVKSETQPSQSPAPNPIQPNVTPDSNVNGSLVQPDQPTQTVTSTMPPPPTIRPSSGSPHPHTLPQAQNTSHHHYPPHQSVAPPGVEPWFRASDRNSILPSLSLTTSPLCGLPRPWNHTIHALPTKVQQSITLSLPPTHHAVQIVPTVPVALTDRPYRLFVTVNGARLMETHRTQEDKNKEKGRPLFDGRLQAGVNRIEVEVIAATAAPPPRGSGIKPQEEKIEWEKMTVYVNLMRH